MNTSTDTIPTEVIEQPKTELTVHQVLSMVNNPERMENESYEDYRQRRTLSNKFVKSYLKGRVVWDPFILRKLMNLKTGLPFTDSNAGLVGNIIKKYEEYAKESGESTK
jgi:hypothetical protein